MGKAILERHLGIKEEPGLARARLQEECIPQQTVGHWARMQNIRDAMSSRFRGRLRVAGTSYMGVGLNDCVRSARDVVVGLRNGEHDTGLGAFRMERKWERFVIRDEEGKALRWGSSV